MKIAYIGVGKLGLPCAEEIAKKGHTITGYDIAGFESELVEQKESIKDLINLGYDDAPDILFIAVPTPHDEKYDGRYPTAHLEPKDFDYTIVKDVLTEVERYANNKTLVVLISTVLPGTVRREFIDLMPRMKHRFVYNPYLIAMGTVAWDMVNPEMVMIGTRDGDETSDAKELIDFYKTIMENNPRYIVGTWDECECIKIFYNTFISTKVSLVNMIQDVAEKQGNIDVDVVTNALANSTHRIMSPMYMTAGMGDGGACHPRDNIALRWMAQELDLGYDLFDAIMNAREKQAKNMAELLVKYKLPIVILGKSYKPGVEYEDGSSSILVGHYVEQFNGSVSYDEVIDTPAVYLLAHPRDTFDEGAEDSVVVDPWRRVHTLHKTVYYGKTR